MRLLLAGELGYGKGRDEMRTNKRLVTSTVDMTGHKDCEISVDHETLNGRIQNGIKDL